MMQAMLSAQRMQQTRLSSPYVTQTMDMGVSAIVGSDLGADFGLDLISDLGSQIGSLRLVLELSHAKKTQQLNATMK